MHELLKGIARQRKKFEPVWDILIRSGQVPHTPPALEAIRERFRPPPTRGVQDRSQKRSRR